MKEKKIDEIQANAVEVVKSLVKKRNWYGGKFERRLASYYKKAVLEDRLSYEMAVIILKELGYILKDSEVWIKPKQGRHQGAGL